MAAGKEEREAAFSVDKEAQLKLPEGVSSSSGCLQPGVGDEVQQEVDGQTRKCCLTLEKNFNEIPEGSAERDTFCAEFVADVSQALNISEELICVDTVEAGSVRVLFSLLGAADDGRSVDVIHVDLIQQISDATSKLRTRRTTSAIKAEESLEQMQEQAQVYASIFYGFPQCLPMYLHRADH